MNRLELVTSLIKLTVQVHERNCPVCAIRQTALDERALAIALCKDEGIGFNWHLISALHNDPIGFYEVLRANGDRQVLIIDHAERLFTDNIFVALMRQAAEFDPERVIQHPETSDSFTTKCRYILFSDVGVDDALPDTSAKLRPFVHGLFDRNCAPFV